MHCILHSSPLSIIHCARHSALVTLRSSLCARHSALGTRHSALGTPLVTLHSSLCTRHSALGTLHSSLSTLHSSLCTCHCALVTLHSSLGTRHCTKLCTRHPRTRHCALYFALVTIEQGRPEPCVYTVYLVISLPKDYIHAYDRIFSDFPAEIAVHTPYIYIRFWSTLPLSHRSTQAKTNV